MREIIPDLLGLNHFVTLRSDHVLGGLKDESRFLVPANRKVHRYSIAAKNFRLDIDFLVASRQIELQNFHFQESPS